MGDGRNRERCRSRPLEGGVANAAPPSPTARAPGCGPPQPERCQCGERRVAQRRSLGPVAPWRWAESRRQRDAERHLVGVPERAVRRGPAGSSSPDRMGW